MSEILHEIEALPEEDRRVLLVRLREMTEGDVPESFRQGMTEARRGELIDLDDALQELDRP